MPLFVERRRGPDRRHSFRGGRRAQDAAKLALLAIAAATMASPVQGRTTAMRFGVEMESVGAAETRGLPLGYGSFWVGSWTQKYGWEYARTQAAAARAAGVTPVVHWWYWGDDISPACVENGCFDARQGVRKDKQTWYRMSEELAAVLDAAMDGREAIVVLETEFNKNGIETYQAFESYLVDHIGIFHAKRNIKVVIGFGNWGRVHWTRFGRAVAVSDLLGTQLLRSSVREPAEYPQAVDTLLEGARHLQATFGKPTLIVDMALSSYPSAEYEAHQAAVITDLFARIGELKSAGVEGLLWRMLSDDPTFDTSNYHGIAERHWGLVRADGTAKPAFDVFRRGVIGEVEAPPPPPPAPVAAPAPAPAPAASPAPAPPVDAASSCNTPDPFTVLGGGTCCNGGWLPPNMACAIAAAPSPAPAQAAPPLGPAPSPAAPAPAAAIQCVTPDPFTALGGGTCCNGGWLPRGMTCASSSPLSPPVPAPAPVTPPPSAGGCITADPFVGIPGLRGECINGGWVPRVAGG